MKNIFFVSLLSLINNAYSEELKEYQDVYRVEIKFDDDEDISGEMSLIYGSKTLKTATIVLLDSNLDTIEYIPIKVEYDSLGASAGVAAIEQNRAMAIDNFDGKTIEDLLGSYFGVKVGVVAMFGAEIMGSININGIILRDINAQMLGLKVDASHVRVKLYKNDKGYYRGYRGYFSNWNAVIRKVE